MTIQLETTMFIKTCNNDKHVEKRYTFIALSGK